MKTTKATPVLSLLLFSLQGAAAEELDPKGSEITNRPPAYWSGEKEAIEKWQSDLAEPDAKGTFTLPGFNVSQPWSGAEPLDWTIKIAVKAGMTVPKSPNGPDQSVVTGGMVWIEPPDGLVTTDNYTANEDWNPFAIYYTSHGLDAPQPEEPLTPFFHRDPGDDRPADGTCEGILSDECIAYIEMAAENDYINYAGNSHRIQDREGCLGISGAARLDLGSPFNLTRRAQDDAAMKYNEGWLVSFMSGMHAEGNATDYAAHGSQYVPILFRWMRADPGELRLDDPKPKGQISKLMCVAVNDVAQGKELPDPGEDYLKAVERKEAGTPFLLPPSVQES